MRKREYLSSGAITDEGAPYALNVPYSRRAFVLWEGVPELVPDIVLENTHYYRVPLDEHMEDTVDFEQAWFDIIPKSELRLSGLTFRGYQSLDDYAITSNEYKYIVDLNVDDSYSDLCVPKYKDEFELKEGETYCLIGYLTTGLLLYGDVLLKAKGIDMPEESFVRHGFVFKKDE